MSNTNVLRFEPRKPAPPKRKPAAPESWMKVPVEKSGLEVRVTKCAGCGCDLRVLVVPGELTGRWYCELCSGTEP